MRAALAALLVVVAVAAGCGGGGSTQEPLGGGAVFMPAGVVAFLAARADGDWRPLLRTVLDREPPRLPKDIVEVDVAVLQGGTTVVMTKPKDGDWRGVPASTQAPSLVDNANYRAATRAAPRDATAIAYVRGDVAADRFAALPGQIATVGGVFRNTIRRRAHLHSQVENIAELRWRWLSAWAAGDGYGARLRSSGPPVAATPIVRQLQRLQPAYPPALLDEIPADVERLVDVTLGPSAFSYIGSIPKPLRPLFPGLDPAALDRVLGGETAVYTRAGAETTVVSSPADVTAALQTLAPLKALHTATIGGQLVVSTTPRGIVAFRSANPKLAGKLDIPARVAGLVYERGTLLGWAAREGDDPTFTVRRLR